MTRKRTKDRPPTDDILRIAYVVRCPKCDAAPQVPCADAFHWQRYHRAKPKAGIASVRNEQIRLAGLRRQRERTNTKESPC